MARVKNVERAVAPGPTKTATPKEYVLTDADWKRVIAEKWLCEFDEGRDYRLISTLKVVNHNTAGEPCYVPTVSNGAWPSCRPLNKPGVMQPYFGQGVPVDGDARVLCKCANGNFTSVVYARQLGTWKTYGYDSDIIAYMVMP